MVNVTPKAARQALAQAEVSVVLGSFLWRLLGLFFRMGTRETSCDSLGWWRACKRVHTVHTQIGRALLADSVLSCALVDLEYWDRPYHTLYREIPWHDSYHALP